MPTKAELETHNRDLQRQINALKAQQRTWGNEALALAKRKGYCNDIQDFLDEQKIPYDVPTVTITVNVTFEIEAEMTDAQEDDFNTDFVESCLKRDGFESFPWSDAHDDDIKEITTVIVENLDVISVKRRD